MFNKDSMLVKTWVRLIENGEKFRKDVPNLFNLKAVVESVLDEK